MERKNQLMLFGMLILLVVINFIKNTMSGNNDLITLVFIFGMICVCSTLAIMKIKQMADKKRGKFDEIKLSADSESDSESDSEEFVALEEKDEE